MVQKSQTQLNVQLIAKSPYKESGPRGVDLYATHLYEELVRLYAQDRYTLERHSTTKTKIDITHYTFFDPFFLTLPWKKTTPRIVTVHDLIPLKFPAHFSIGVRGRLKWEVQKQLLRRSEAIITDSECSALDIATIVRYPKDKIHVVPLAAPNTLITASLARGVQKEYGLPDRYLLYVGDINWNKNIPSLIHSFAEISDKKIHLVLAGKAFVSGEETRELVAIKEAIAQSKQQSRIHLLGFVPSHHLGALYKQATLYIQPSWYEGFGFPILEAMMQGCPVLSSNQGSLPEVGGICVHYFDPTVKGDLTKHLTLLLQNDVKRVQWVENGKKWAKTFTWEKVAKQTRMIYEAILH